MSATVLILTVTTAVLVPVYAVQTYMLRRLGRGLAMRYLSGFLLILGGNVSQLAADSLLAEISWLITTLCGLAIVVLTFTSNRTHGNGPAVSP